MKTKALLPLEGEYRDHVVAEECLTQITPTCLSSHVFASSSGFSKWHSWLRETTYAVVWYEAVLEPV